MNFWEDYREIEAQLEAVQLAIQARLDIKQLDVSGALQLFASSGGKMLRPALFLLFAGLTEKPIDYDKNIKVAASLELLHLATLVHDDIIDDAPTRRRQETLQSKLGKDIAVYVGDYLYTVYFEILCETMADTPFLAQNAQSMKRILHGELLQDQLKFKVDVSLQQYFHVIAGKTAELIALSCEEGAYFGGLDRRAQLRARRVGRNIGLAFQIYDDVLNFSLKFKNEKPILTDVCQGIFTLPLLLAREAAPGEIDTYLESPERLSQGERIKLAELVSQTGGLDQALQLAESLSNKALAEISLLPTGNNQEILGKATKKLLKRTY